MSFGTGAIPPERNARFRSNGAEGNVLDEGVL